MDSDSRPFQPICVSLIGVESSIERFPEPGNVNRLTVSKWRNNLTALSQRYNLYFMATESDIVVYEPDFPFQKLKSKPALRIRPILANVNARGYISHRRGVDDHSINHLIVGELGTQEIILLSTDSGNVAAYHTSAILDAVNKEPYKFSDRGLADLVGLRPFFSEWVQQSAWGLAIHKNARMIAVSSNTPSRDIQPASRNDDCAGITVFAFALDAVSSSSNGGSSFDGDMLRENEESSIWTDWVPINDNSVPSRDRNYKIILAGEDGHLHNIPNIAFVNTEEDLEGSWMISTDISGLMKLWQIWKAKCYKSWHFVTRQNTAAAFFNSYPGWNVAALDIRSFKLVQSTEELIGARRAPMYYGYNQQGESFNITNIVRRSTPGNSEFHPQHPHVLEAKDEAKRDIELFNPFTDFDDDSIPASHNSDPGKYEHRVQTLYSHSEPEAQQSSTSELEPIHESSDGFSSDEMEYLLDMIETDSENGSEDENEPRSPASQGSITSAIDAHNLDPATPVRHSSKDTGQVAPTVALLHCGDSHIRLLSSPRTMHPHIFCAHILRQILPDNVHITLRGAEFSHMDRLNMLQQIPELGLVLIATQTGRVALCSLTRRQDDLLGLRVDAILPTEEEERKGMRPDLTTLAGIAIAPIQGHCLQDADEDSGEGIDTDFNDGIINGIPTSFDPLMVTLKDAGQTLPVSQPNKEKIARRKRTKPKTNDPPYHTQPVTWRKSRAQPFDGSILNGIRYRLMLTYCDSSIITYEISRDIDKNDIAVKYEKD